MPRITEERRARQRERIIDAMLAAIRERGIAGTAMSEVIERSGLSAGAIYGYYSGKDEILLAAAERVLQGRVDVLESLATADPVPDPQEALRVFLGSLPEGAREGGAVVQVWGLASTQPGVRSIAEEVVDAFHDSIRAYLEAWFRSVRRADPAEDARRAAPVVLAMFQGYIVQAALGREPDLDSYIAGLGALLDPSA